MNYLDQVAERITIHLRDEWAQMTEHDRNLYRIYSLLALTTGVTTTNENVHDAWSAWKSGAMPTHRALIPFDHLDALIQDLDTPYRDAIRAVALAHTPAQEATPLPRFKNAAHAFVAGYEGPSGGTWQIEGVDPELAHTPQEQTTREA